MTDPSTTDSSRALTTGECSRAFAGLLYTVVPVAVALGLIWLLSWLLAEQTALARLPAWLAWGLATPAAAFVVFAAPIALLIFAGRNYKG